MVESTVITTGAKQPTSCKNVDDDMVAIEREQEQQPDGEGAVQGGGFIWLPPSARVGRELPRL